MKKILVLAGALLLLLSLALVAHADAWDMTFKQEALDSRVLVVEAPGVDTIAKNWGCDGVNVIAKVFNSKIGYTEEAEFKFAISDFDPEAKTIKMELPNFGKWQVTAEFTKKGQITRRVKDLDVYFGVTKANIVDCVATTDTLITALKWYTEDGAIDTSIPTFLDIRRPKAFDWQNLPENMYRHAMISAERNEEDIGYWRRCGYLSEFVRDLLIANPDTYFNFYLNDYHMRTLARLAWANKVPDGNYSVTMVTDGSASYSMFRRAYSGTDNAAALHAQYVKETEEYRAGIKSGKITNYEDMLYLRDRVYALMDVEEAHGNPVRWWVVRKSGDTFGLPDADFQAKVLADTRITNNYINNLLAAMSAAGNDEAFKTLYSFEDEMFQNERDQGKKLLMFLGSSAAVERDYPPMDYIKFHIAFYGDTYAYFYKGHPGNVQVELEENKKPYTDIGVHVLDASIAAELFTYFNPDIYVSGYESSYYQNTGNEEQDVGLFRKTFESALANPNIVEYAPLMDLFISDMAVPDDASTYAGNEDALKVLDAALKAVPAEEAGDHTYLVQFNNANKQVCEYDFALWNATREVIHYLTGSVEEGLTIAE